MQLVDISNDNNTKSPFLLFGAPWMKSKKILKELIQEGFSGLDFSLFTFKPRSIENVSKYPKYQDELCFGIKIKVVDKNKIEPLQLTLFILKTIQKYHPHEFSFDNNNFISKLYGNNDMKNNIFNREPMMKLLNVWEKESYLFSTLRTPYLLY